MQTINVAGTPIHPDSLKQPSVAGAPVCTLHLFVKMHGRRKKRKKKKSAPAMGKLITELGLRARGKPAAAGEPQPGAGGDQTLPRQPAGLPGTRRALPGSKGRRGVLGETVRAVTGRSRTPERFYKRCPARPLCTTRSFPFKGKKSF